MHQKFMAKPNQMDTRKRISCMGTGIIGLLRADTAFLGVALEPGSHTVAFTYKTPGLTAGAALSAAGVVLLAAIWAVPALRKKSKKRRK